MESNLSVRLTGQAKKDSANWLKLVQELKGEYAPFANLFDTYQMLTRGRGGISARTYTIGACSNIIVAGDTIRLNIDFRVHPSRMDLAYSLKAFQAGDEEETPVGTISAKKYDPKRIENSYIIGLTDTLTFDYLIDQVSLSWETPCYNELGEMVGIPGYEVKDNRLVFSAKIFAVVRISLLALGYSHTLSLTAARSGSGATDIKSRVNTAGGIIVRASYEGGSTDLTLDLSQVQKALDNCLPQCSDGSLIGGGGSLIVNPDDDKPPATYTVYFSTCQEDTVLEVRKNEQ